MRPRHLTAALILTLLTTLARAAELVPTNIPANARWVVHLDADAARAGKVWDLLQSRFIAPNQAAFDNQVRVIETLTGMKFPADLHDLTLFGTSFAGEDTCILIHAVVDQAKVTDFLKLDPEFKSDPYNDHDLLTWRDKDHDRLLHAAFFGTERIIVSPSEKLVRTVLDAMDGKTKAKADALADASLTSPPKIPAAPPIAVAPAPGEKATVVLFAAAQGLSDLQQPGNPLSPVIAQADAAWLSISQAGDNLVARLSLKAKTEKTAEQLHDLAKGVHALLALLAQGQHPDEKIKAASAALEHLIVRLDGRVVSLELTTSLADFKNLLEAAHIGPDKQEDGIKQ